MFKPPELPKIELPENDLPIDLPMHHMWSDTQFEIIKRYVQEYESTLDKEHEVGLLLTSFGQSVLMQVTSITYEESVLMIFKGFVDGKEATLIQHINQLNFLLTSIDKAPKKEKTKIGFDTRR